MRRDTSRISFLCELLRHLSRTQVKFVIISGFRITENNHTAQLAVPAPSGSGLLQGGRGGRRAHGAGLCHLDGVLYLQLLVQRHDARPGLVFPNQKLPQVFVVKLFKPGNKSKKIKASINQYYTD